MRLPPWHVHPTVWFVIVLVEGTYLLAIRDRNRRNAEVAAGRGGAGAPMTRERAATRRQIALFSIGVAVLWIGAEWPIHDLAERYLYSMHMVQHILFMLVAPPLLIAGTPVWMLRRILAPRPVAAAARILTRPIVALVIFNGILLLTHWPAVVDLSVRSEAFHFGAHTLLVGSALLMWWPVMSPLPELPALPAPAQILYLFVQSLAPTIPASFLTFGTKPLYPIYATFPRIWGISALTDQLIAGLIMKIVGSAILWGFITAIFFRWHAREERDGLDALQWRDVERDVRAGLSSR
ncbi:MAG: cytochrome c oxidase assembly protein [Actinomycetota bacterium]|nr:cytochrome c oxidase assembly protein [Actinomycetota bacterium]